jgi:hypothetical protein
MTVLQSNSRNKRKSVPEDNVFETSQPPAAQSIMLDIRGLVDSSFAPFAIFSTGTKIPEVPSFQAYHYENENAKIVLKRERFSMLKSC